MRRRLCAILLSIAGALPLAARADPDEKPLWEAGIGVIGFHLPDYRGADESRGYLFPFPFFAYRGERLRLDREGLRGIFLETDRVEFNISMYATPPVDSADNQARQGMPDLDPTVEIGPVLNLTLARDRVQDWRFDFKLPVRAVFATDLSYLHNIGYTFFPHLHLALHPTFLDGKWDVGLNAGPLFATNKYHRYFYNVDTQHATPDRPAYTAPGGYSGLVTLASLTRRFRKFWVGGFVRYDYLKGAAFEDSPLVKQKDSFMAGLSIAWVFAESEKKVERDD
jgi:outer membrane scaffolding protein for murein synthesis (MipA/OmpV family)